MTHSAEKDLGNLSKSVVPVLWEKIKALADEPRPRQAKKLKGAERAYRLRVRGYRVIYIIDDEQKLVTVTAIRHRKEVYR
jgi:mRNA interferase RelE/StbE